MGGRRQLRNVPSSLNPPASLNPPPCFSSPVQLRGALSALADAIRPGATGGFHWPGDVPELSMARLGPLVLQEKKAKFGDEQFDDAGCKEAFMEVMQLALKCQTKADGAGEGGSEKSIV